MTGDLKTMTYEVTDRVARITFNRPEKGNAIVADTPLELVALVERADLDPGVHVILVSGRGSGFCAGFDLSARTPTDRRRRAGMATGERCWMMGRPRPSITCRTSPGIRMIDYQMMSRFRAGLLQPHARRQAHGGQDSRVLRGRRHGHRAPCRPGDRRRRRAKIGYPPTRVWGVPAAGLWAHRLGDQRAKRLLLTGDCITGAGGGMGLTVGHPTADLEGTPSGSSGESPSR